MVGKLLNGFGNVESHANNGFNNLRHVAFMTICRIHASHNYNLS